MLIHSGKDLMFETVGECLAKIRHGQVVEIGEPRIRGCPLAKRFDIASSIACWGCQGRLPGPFERVLLWTRMLGSAGR
jgi:Uncharacterized protein conserved in archaea (DUF2099)